jgi:hypothetical protein
MQKLRPTGAIRICAIAFGLLIVTASIASTMIMRWLTRDTAGWQSVQFDPANFRAADDGEWIVEPNGITGYSYRLIGNDTMIFQWSIEATTVKGEPSELYLTIPGGRFAVTEQSSVFSYYDNFQPGGADTPLEFGIALTTRARQNYLQLRRQGSTGVQARKWSNAKGGASGTYVFGQITLRLDSSFPSRDQ